MKEIANFDERNAVFWDGQYVVRRMRPAFAEETKKYIKQCQDADLFSKGLCPVILSEDEDGVTLRQKRLVIIYPFEWPPSLLKDAAIFVLDLFEELYVYGLVLKDPMPENVLYDFGDFQYVDFGSVIPFAELKNERWLWGQLDPQGDGGTEMLRLTFLRNFIFPLLAYHLNKRHVAEYLLKNAAPHMQYPSLSEMQILSLLGDGTAKWAFFFLKRRLCPASAMIKKCQNLFTNSDYCTTIKRLRKFVESLEVSYSENKGYYQSRKHTLDFASMDKWSQKQKNVLDILKKIQPGRVLDIGCNTGWYSLLAARNGAKVISLDIEISNADILYQKARKQLLPVIPFYSSYTQFQQEWYPFSRLQPKNLSFPDRQKVDMVFCLALLHHMALGDGNSITDLVKFLSRLSSESLLIEYVDWQDQKIAQNTSAAFFYRKNLFTAKTYSLKALLEEGKKYFKSYELFNSTPQETRTLVLFTEKK